MTSERVEVITSVQRRRRWSTEEKERLVAAATAPGANASAVARAAGLHTSQLFRKRCFGSTCFLVTRRENLEAFAMGRWDYDGYAGRS